MTGQINGSITFDTTKLGEALVAALGPALTRIEDNLARLTGLLSSGALSERQTAEVLADHMPLDGPDPILLAQYMTNALSGTGYALVAVAGAALQGELTAMQFEPGLVAQVEENTGGLSQAEREDHFFSPGRVD